MNDDDLETRLRSWQPADVPWELGVRLRAADPARTSARRRTAWFWLGAGALAAAASVAAFALAPGVWPEPPALETPTPAAPVVKTSPPWRNAFGESLTMDLHTGVRRDFFLVAQRLDGGGPVEEIPAPFSRGGISAKVDCQF